MERLLDGVGGTDRVSRLIGAARAPGRRHELGREEAAVLAFRAARVGDLSQARDIRSHARPPDRSRSRRWAGLAGLKIAAGVVLVLGAGVALAAGTGVLPNPIINTSSTATGPGETPDTPSGPTTSNANRQTETPVGGSSSSTATVGPSASPSPSLEQLVDLCGAFQAHGDRDPGKSMDSTAFQRLAAAAGGEDKVAAFCEQLLGHPAPASASAPTTPTSLPTPSVPAAAGQGDAGGNHQQSDPVQPDPQES